MGLKHLSLALAFCLGATGARAADGELMAAFNIYCLDTHGDGAVVDTVALGSGWAVAPATASKQPDMHGFFKKVGDQVWTLVVQDVASAPDQEMPFPTHRQFCAVFRAPPISDARAAMRAVLGVEPTQAQGPQAAWAYVEHGDAREFLTDMDDGYTRKALASGPMVVILVRATDKGTMLAIGRLTKTAP